MLVLFKLLLQQKELQQIVKLENYLVLEQKHRPKHQKGQKQLILAEEPHLKLKAH
jgi:hypothetical protein